MKYLTAAYVEWLGLEVVPVIARNPYARPFAPEGGTLPMPGRCFDEGVVLGDRVYTRMPWGSFDLTYDRGAGYYTQDPAGKTVAWPIRRAR